MLGPIAHYGISNLTLDTTGALHALATDDQGNGDVLKFAPGASGEATPVAVIDTAPGAGTLDSSLIVVGP